MSDFTSVVKQIESGDPSAAELLLPLVYNELRNLAAARLSREKPGHPLQATGLVHEAYLRLVSAGEPQRWESRGHFFAAAAEAMRRILIEKARSKRDANTATNQPRSVWDGIGFEGLPDKLDVLVLNDAILKLEAEYPQQAQVVKLRFFTGLTHGDIAGIMNLSSITVKRYWRFARVWLHRQMQAGEESSN